MREALKAVSGRIVVCLIDTNAKVWNFAPPAVLHASDRWPPRYRELAHPFYDLPAPEIDDIAANHAKVRYAASYGGRTVFYSPFEMLVYSRPLFAGCLESVVAKNEESSRMWTKVADLAAYKMTGLEGANLATLSTSGMFALFGARFGVLPIDQGTSQRLMAAHMATLISVSEGREVSLIKYLPEPLIGLGATLVMNRTGMFERCFKLFAHLIAFGRVVPVSRRGDYGEVSCAMLFMRSFDNAHSYIESYDQSTRPFPLTSVQSIAYDKDRDVSCVFSTCAGATPSGDGLLCDAISEASAPVPLLNVLLTLIADAHAPLLSGFDASTTLGRLLHDGWMWPLQAVKMEQKAADCIDLLEYAWRRRLALMTVDDEPVCDMILPLVYFDEQGQQKLTAMLVESKCRADCLSDSGLGAMRRKMYEQARMLVEEGPIVLVIMELGIQDRDKSRVVVDGLRGADVDQWPSVNAVGAACAAAGAGRASGSGATTARKNRAAQSAGAQSSTTTVPPAADSSDVLFVHVRGLFSTTIGVGKCIDAASLRYMRLVLNEPGIRNYHINTALGDHCGYDEANARIALNSRLRFMDDVDKRDMGRRLNARAQWNLRKIHVNRRAKAKTVASYDPYQAAVKLSKVVQGRRQPSDQYNWLDFLSHRWDAPASDQDEARAAGSARVRGVAAPPPPIDDDDGKRPI
jgi:hypothetical protein